MAKSRGRKFAEITSPASGVFDITSVPTITNAKLQNSAMTLAGNSVSLGGTGVANTDALSEGSSNLYFTNARVQSFLGGGTLAGNIVVPDNRSIYVGSQSDFRIIHNTTNTQLINATGALQITSNGGFDVTGAATFSSTIAATGAITANAGVVVDNITIDGTEIDLSSGDLTLDVAGNIVLDADGGGVYFKDAGTNIGFLQNSGANDFRLVAGQTDKDIVFMGNDSDGGGTITALTLDMSDAGTATFNHDVKLGDGSILFIGASPALALYHAGNNSYIQNQTGALIHTTATFVVNNAANDENMISAYENGAVTLYHNHVARLTTTSTGVSVTGTIASGSITSTGNSVFNGSGTGHAIEVNRTDGSQALRVNDTGEVIVSNNYLYASRSSGAGLYVQSTAVFRGSIINDGGNDLSISSGSANINFNSKNFTSVGTIGTTGNIGVTAETAMITLTDASTSRYTKVFADDNNSVVRASGPLLLQVGTSSAITIDSNKQVGIGTGSPAQLFHVSAGTSASTSVRFGQNFDTSIEIGPVTATASGMLKFLNASGTSKVAMGFRDSGSGSDGAFRIRRGATLDSSGPLFNFGTSGEVEIIKSSVSSAHADSFATLYVQDAEARLQLMSANTGDNASAVLLSNVNKHWGVHHHGPDGNNMFSIGYHESSSSGTDIANALSDKFNINTSGNVGIGSNHNETRRNLGLVGSTPGVVFYDSNVTNLQHEIVGGGNAGLEIAADFNNVGTGYVRFDVGGVERMRIKENGTITAGIATHYRFVETVYRRSFSVSKTYVHVANINGSNLGTSYEVHVKGTTSGVVVNAHFHIMVGHYYDIGIKSFGLTYTNCKVKVVSNGNEDNSLYIGINTNSTAALAVSIRTHDGAAVDMTPSGGYNTCYLEHAQSSSATQETTTASAAAGAGPADAY